MEDGRASTKEIKKVSRTREKKDFRETISDEKR